MTVIESFIGSTEMAVGIGVLNFHIIDDIKHIDELNS